MRKTRPPRQILFERSTHRTFSGRPTTGQESSPSAPRHLLAGGSSSNQSYTSSALTTATTSLTRTCRGPQRPSHHAPTLPGTTDRQRISLIRTEINGHQQCGSSTDGDMLMPCPWPVPAAWRTTPMPPEWPIRAGAASPAETRESGSNSGCLGTPSRVAPDGQRHRSVTPPLRCESPNGRILRRW
jgi:hypothetical protein